MILALVNAVSAVTLDVFEFENFRRNRLKEEI